MSEDVKKNLRTQGKYSENRIFKSRDKRQKESPTDKEPPGKKSHSQRQSSSGSKEQNVSFNDEPAESFVQYKENSNHSFEKLDTVKKPIEIKTAGLHTLSETANGESMVLYEPKFFDPDEACDYFDYLCDTTLWNEKNIVIRDVEYPQPRLVAWYGPFPYSYSGVILEAQEMPSCVIMIKERIEAYLLEHNINVTLNSVLLNNYRDGKDSVAWHSDNELTMGVCPTIASVSLGETRKFEMKRNLRSYDTEISPDQVDMYFVQLSHGSLLIMNGSMQTDWLHRVPKEYHDKRQRINLTFRTVYSLEKIPSEISYKEYCRHSPKIIETSMQPLRSNVNWDEEDFPPLGSTVNSISSEIDNSLDEKSEVSNSSKTNEDDKSMDCYDSDVPCFSSSYTDSHINNLNVEKQSIKHGMLNKNVDINYSIADDSDAVNANESCNSSSCTNDGHMDVSMESVVSNATKFSGVEDTNPSYSPPCSSNLNVEAKEFVPSVSPIVTSEINQYDNASWDDLRNIDTHTLEDKEAEAYTFALKKKIEEEAREFKYYEFDELKFLFHLMEDELTKKNQRLITERMRCLVNRSFKPSKFSNVQRFPKPNDRYPKPSHHENDDYYNSTRSYMSQNRGISSQGKRSNSRREERHPKTEQENPSHGSENNREYSNRGRGNSGNEYGGREDKYSVRDRAHSSRGKIYNPKDERNSNREKETSSWVKGYNHKEKQSSNIERRNSLQEKEYDRTEEYSNRGKETSSCGKGNIHREGGHSNTERRNSQEKEYNGTEGYSNRGRGNSIPRNRYSESRRGGRSNRGRSDNHE